MTDHEGLQELAARPGVEVRWSNAWGDQQDVPPQTLRAVLRAMGVAAENDDQVTRSLHDADQPLWRERLPPVIVTHESRAAGVEVRIVADAAANRQVQDQPRRILRQGPRGLRAGGQESTRH